MFPRTGIKNQNFKKSLTDGTPSIIYDRKNSSPAWIMDKKRQHNTRSDNAHIWRSENQFCNILKLIKMLFFLIALKDSVHVNLKLLAGCFDLIRDVIIQLNHLGPLVDARSPYPHRFYYVMLRSASIYIRKNQCLKQNVQKIASANISCGQVYSLNIKFEGAGGCCPHLLILNIRNMTKVILGHNWLGWGNNISTTQTKC